MMCLVLKSETCNSDFNCFICARIDLKTKFQLCLNRLRDHSFKPNFPDSLTPLWDCVKFFTLLISYHIHFASVRCEYIVICRSPLKCFWCYLLSLLRTQTSLLVPGICNRKSVRLVFTDRIVKKINKNIFLRHLKAWICFAKLRILKV